jgi:16S rRNA (cytosine967-C5)-methyltransferase
LKKSYSTTSHKYPRQIALEILTRLEKTGSHADQLLGDYFRDKTTLSSREKAFITELVYGTLRWRNSIDWVIEQFSSSPHRRISRQLKNLLRLGIYQVLYLENVPIPASVYATVDLAKSSFNERTASLVNGVLRNVERNQAKIPYPPLHEDPANAIAIRYSHPVWLVKQWIHDYGVSETIALCKANNTAPPFTIRTNTLRIPRNELVEHFLRQGISCAPTPFAPEGIILSQPSDITRLSSFQKGWFVVQDEAAQLIAHLVFPKSGEDILELCAAPGGKTTHLAQLMNNQGRIVAVDIRLNKLALLKENESRLGVTIIKAVLGDASCALPLKDEEAFDKILLDVPCSGVGILRRHPEGKWVKSLRTASKLEKTQSAILKNAARYVKPGGIMVYSTCTLNAQENEQVVERFVSKTGGAFRVEAPLHYLPPQIERWIDRRGYLKTLPHRGAMDGFFGACLRKIT